jgi:hypothetical protein
MMRAWPLLLLTAALSGCYYLGFYAYKSEGGGTEAALGEEHEINYPQHEAQLFTEDALRGKGVLFEVRPDNQIVTNWQKPDISAGVLPSLVGVEPRYRYEIQVTPEDSSRSKIVVNVRAEDIPDSAVANYKASKTLNLFHEIDEVAALAPPPERHPGAGGVNFTLLPNEDLKGLARRVTGNPDNWQQIAKDNGLKSPNDVTPFQSVWVRSSLLKNVSGAASPGHPK